MILVCNMLRCFCACKEYSINITIFALYAAKNPSFTWEFGIPIWIPLLRDYNVTDELVWRSFPFIDDLRCFMFLNKFCSITKLLFTFARVDHTTISILMSIEGLCTRTGDICYTQFFQPQTNLIPEISTVELLCSGNYEFLYIRVRVSIK